MSEIMEQQQGNNLNAEFDFDGCYFARATSPDQYWLTSSTNDCYVVLEHGEGAVYSIIINIAERCKDFIGSIYQVDPRYFEAFTPTDEKICSWISNIPEDCVSRELAMSAITRAGERKDVLPVQHEARKAFPIITDADEMKNIIKEMKSKVDFNRFKILLSMCAQGNQSDSKKTFVADDVAEQYLDVWAKAKYRVYLAFGRQLRLSDDYSSDITPELFYSRLLDLCRNKYQRYYLTMVALPNAVVLADLMDDKISLLDDSYRIGAPTIFSKSKSTTFFHALFEDDKFDADFANLLLDKKDHKRIAISIDPADYITMSKNQHNWRSCHRPGGEWAGGGFAYMTDCGTAIAYMYDGNDSRRYMENGFVFKCNSKEWRQCVYIDPDTCGAIFSRQYPRNINDVSAAVRKLYENTVDSADTVWKVSKDNRDKFNYERNSDFCYHDVDEGFNFTFIHRADDTRRVNFVVGGRVYCVVCGEELNSLGDGNRVACVDCVNNMQNGTAVSALSREAFRGQ